MFYGRCIHTKEIIDKDSYSYTYSINVKKPLQWYILIVSPQQCLDDCSRTNFSL